MSPGLRTVEEHLAAILAVVPAPPVVEVPLHAADGLVLAADVAARGPLPPWDASAMDGYAVRADDVAPALADRPVRLRVVADLPAGSAQEPVLGPGECARIMTGAPVPRTADAVVPVEDTDGGTAVVQVRAAVPAGRHVRRAGEDVRTGDLAVPAGTLLRAPQLAAAAAAGHGALRVHPRPVVGVLSTGSELVPPGTALRRGTIPDSNSLLLAAVVREAGCEPVRVGAVPDDVDALRAALAALLAPDPTTGRRAVDAVVTSGGVSVGAYDVVKSLGGELAATFASVAMQPGKPQGLAVLHRADGAPVPLVALPGNPVSAFVSAEVFVRPALAVLRGLPAGALDRPRVRAVAGAAWRTPPGRRQYLPVRLVPGAATEGGGPAGEGAVVVVPAGPGGSGSHLAVTLAAADGLGVVDAAVAQVRPGDTVEVMLTRGSRVPAEAGS